MAGKAPLQVFSPHTLQSICPLIRSVQLPAQVFQSFARTRPIGRSRFHTSLWSLQEQSAALLNRDGSSQINTDTDTSLVVDQKDNFATANPTDTLVRRVKTSLDPSRAISRKHSKTSTSTSTSTPSLESSPSKGQFRNLMRMVTHPVTIVTSADTNVRADPISQAWRGATVSSFNSVTLDPDPYISFNIKKLSSTYDAIRSSGLFAVHLMSHTAEAVEIATHFSRGNNKNADLFVLNPTTTNNDPYHHQQTEPSLHSFVTKYPARPRELSEEQYPYLPPLLQWRTPQIARAVLFQMVCSFEAEKAVEVGDHVIVVGKVIRAYGNLVEATEQQQHQVSVPEKCLTYAKGKYSHPRWSYLLQLGPRAETTESEDISTSRTRESSSPQSERKNIGTDEDVIAK